MFTALIVEDMPQAVDILTADLKEHCPDVEVIGTANSVVNAAQFLGNHKPDLIFLDIMLGDGTGFNLLEIFPDLSSKVIFVTASDEHAIRAFRYAAIDYLLKPVNPEDLVQAVQRAKEQITHSKESISLLTETYNHPNVLPRRISLHTQDRILVVDIDNIIRCESEGNYTWFFLNTNTKIYVTKTLKQFEQLLLPHNFLRTHQSHLINPLYIKEFIKRDGGYLVMKNGDKIPVSVRKRAVVMEWLS